jgi:hypothetical protein
MPAIGNPLVASGVVAGAGAALAAGVEVAGVLVGIDDGSGVGVAVMPSTDPAGVGDDPAAPPAPSIGVADARGVTVGAGVGVGFGGVPFSVDPGAKHGPAPQVSGEPARSIAGGT